MASSIEPVPTRIIWFVPCEAKLSDGSRDIVYDVYLHQGGENELVAEKVITEDVGIPVQEILKKDRRG